jgi:hypothetical protein
LSKYFDLNTKVLLKYILNKNPQNSQHQSFRRLYCSFDDFYTHGQGVISNMLEVFLVQGAELVYFFQRRQGTYGPSCSATNRDIIEPANMGGLHPRGHNF